MLTQSEIKFDLDYDHLSGVFRWKNSKRRVKAGDVAGAVNGDGYILIRLNGILHRAHRLAWLYVNGSFPSKDLDHIDGNRTNNAIANLRQCSRGENLQNQRLPSKNNALKSLGVCFNKQSSKFHAQITYNRTRYHLGYFKNKDEAHAAYVEAKRKLHKFGTL